MPSRHPLDLSVVRIISEKGPVGAGFLVGEGQILTCAHVVADALGLPIDHVQKPSGEVLLDFPFLDSPRLTAKIERWVPRRQGDLAVLSVKGDLPPDVRPVRLRKAEFRLDHRIHAYGFPRGRDRGVWFHGRLVGLRANGHLQIEGDQVGIAIQGGFSGGPVWDPNVGAVIGMVVTRDPDLATKVAACIPVIQMRQHYEALPVITVKPQVLTEGLPFTGLHHFLREYLGTETEPVPFGGRGGPIEDLNAWLEDPDQPFALLVAEAGRGKSALLAQWARRVAEDGRAEVAFVPVSIRFGTALETETVELLGERLRYLYGIKATHPPDLKEIRQLLAEPRTEAQQQLLLIIDGADEATGWTLSTKLRLPVPPGNRVKILVSAREKVDDPHGNLWAEDLGMDRFTRVLLPPLDEEGLAEVLHSVGDPFIGEANRDLLIRQLLHVTKGDPLLIRLYVSAIRTGEIDPGSLGEDPPGLEGYLDRWWRGLRAQWHAGGLSFEREAETLLNLFACAQGPLNRNDLLSLTDSFGFTWGTIEQALEALSRIVIGERNQGYVFSHPRLAWYFAEKLDAEGRRTWEELFVQYGQAKLTALAEGRIAESAISPYLLRHYGTHLQRLGAEPERLYALVSHPWMKAWGLLESSYSGFLRDVDRSWKLAEVNANLPIMAMGALAHSSVATIGLNIPPALLQRCLAEEIITFQQALSWARLNPLEHERARALALIFPLLPATLQEMVISDVHRMADGMAKAVAMAQIACSVSQVDESLCLTAVDALAGVDPATALLRDEEYTAALTLLAKRGTDSVVQGLLTFAMTPSLLLSRPSILAALLPRLNERQQAEVFATLQENCQRDPPTGGWTDLLAILPEDVRAPIVARLESQVSSMMGEPVASFLAADILPYLPTKRRDRLIQTLLEFDSDWDPTDWPHWRTSLLEVLPKLPAKWLDDALTFALSPTPHLELLVALLPRCSDKLLEKAYSAVRPFGQLQVIVRTIARQKDLKESDIRETILHEPLESQIALVPFLPAEALPQVLQNVFADAPSFQLGFYLRKLLPSLPAELAGQALAHLRNVADAVIRMDGLTMLIPNLSRVDLELGLEMCRSIRDGWARGQLIRGLVPVLPAAERVEMLAQEFEVAKHLPSRESRVEALCGLIPHLTGEAHGEAIDQALQNARGCHKRTDQIWSLCKIAEVSPAKSQLSQEALKLAEHSSRGTWAQVRAWIFPHLPASLRPDFLQELFLAAENEPHYAPPLGTLLPHLAPAEQDRAWRILWAGRNTIKTDLLRTIAARGSTLPTDLAEPAFSFAAKNYDAVAMVAATERLTKSAVEDLLLAARPSRPFVEAGLRSRLAFLEPTQIRKDQLWAQVLDTAQQIQEPREQAELLIRLLPHLSEQLSDRAVPLLLAHPISTMRWMMWRRELAPLAAPWVEAWASRNPHAAQVAVQDLLRACVDEPRHELLKILHACIPFLLALGGGALASALLKAVRETGEWWP